MPIGEYINPESDCFYYEAETGRLFRIEEIEVVREDSDGKVRARRRGLATMLRLCYIHWPCFSTTMEGRI
jgi:hypothetical protein